MTKTELIARIVKKNPHLYIRDVKELVSTVFGEISDALEQGHRVEFRNFGTFSVRYREPRMGRNPRTGESVLVPAKAVPFFKIGTLLHERINDTGNGVDAETSAGNSGAAGKAGETLSPAAGPRTFSPASSTTPRPPLPADGGPEEEDRA